MRPSAAERHPAGHVAGDDGTNGATDAGRYVSRHFGRCVGGYVGRFAPSPTGPLHAGSLVAALASWLDARAHGGTWLVRIEDTDTPRCVPGAAEHILAQLAAAGLVPDGAVWWQSARGEAYAQALQQLTQAQLAYPCACSRSDIERALLAAGTPHTPGTEAVYPGTCRAGLQGREGRATRLRAHELVQAQGPVHWSDRRLGDQAQDVAQAAGDVVLKRADGLWAYQLAVVVDDAAQGVTDVVRGEDLADQTPRQILLQQALGLPRPRYLHTPLVRDASGQKLSKQNGAPGVPLHGMAQALHDAAEVLGLGGVVSRSAATADMHTTWVAAWKAAWGDRLP